MNTHRQRLTVGRQSGSGDIKEKVRGRKERNEWTDNQSACQSYRCYDTVRRRGLREVGQTNTARPPAVELLSHQRVFSV